jgi:hypothetical protein
MPRILVHFPRAKQRTRPTVFVALARFEYAGRPSADRARKTISTSNQQLETGKFPIILLRKIPRVMLQ